MRVLLLSGPNLSQLGLRDPAVYGTATLEDLVVRAREVAATLGAELVHHQHEGESELVRAVHAACQDGPDRVDAIVINAGALTHYGLSLRDALEIARIPKVELHLSNTQAREPFRHTSVLAAVCDGVVAGFGALGYELAVRAAVGLVGARHEG